MKKKISTALKVLFIISLSIVLFSCDKKVAVNEEVEELTEAFRTVTVASVKGTATVKHKDGQSVKAYEGMALYDGDDVIVDTDSNLIIDADSDKHLLAEGGSHFWLSIDGTDDCTKTKINLEAGAVLCQIEEKLADGESFDVTTASSTMCVRGTVFRVNAIKALNSEIYDVVEVYDGKVWSYINDAEVEEIETGNTDGQVVLEPGQCAVIKEATELAGAAYITADQIDQDSWENGDFSIVINDKKEATGSPVLNIAYNKLPSVVVDQLVAIIDGGTELSIEKKDLEELSTPPVQENNNVEKQKDVHQALIVPGVIVEEDRYRSDLNDDICAQYGHTIILVNGVRQCTICGLRFSEEYHETEQDKKNAEEFKKETGFDSITIPSFSTKNTKVEVTVTAEPSVDSAEDTNESANQTPDSKEKIEDDSSPASSGKANDSIDNNSPSIIEEEITQSTDNSENNQENVSGGTVVQPGNLFSSSVSGSVVIPG